MLINGADPLTPRPGPVDPVSCVVCGGLRTALRLFFLADDLDGAMDTIRLMHVHRVRGHPEDVD